MVDRIYSLSPGRTGGEKPIFAYAQLIGFFTKIIRYSPQIR
jgi:hypothetical protein